ncbi:MAG: TonB-dependent receptor [Polyangiaceae bacterium]|nr:TonB-dependent receptor [Polyangiaceae bacterium]
MRCPSLLQRLAGTCALLVATREAGAQPAEPEDESDVKGEADPKADAPVEVEVVGEKPPPSSTTLSAREVRALPGAFGDPFRAIEILPGVTPVTSGVPYFFVRGAPPANVGYYIDGVRVPLLFHVGLGPSVIHPRLVERVDLHAGAYPARLGRFAGGIVEGSTKPPCDVLTGETSLRLFDTGTMVEVPIDGGRASILGAYRYSYAGALVSLFSPDVDLEYWDYQARGTYAVTDDDKLSVFAFGSHDRLSDTDDTGQPRTVLDADFHRVDARWDHAFSPATDMRTAFTFGFDRSVATSREHVAESFMWRLRNELVHRVAPGLVFHAGADTEVEKFDVVIARASSTPTMDDAILRALLPSRTDVTAGAYADVVIDVTPAFDITPGLRVDLYTSDDSVDIAFDPRLATRLSIGDRLRITQTVGLASQAPSLLGAIPGLQPTLDGGLQRSLLTSVGAEVKLPEDVTTMVTFFRNAFFEMSDAIGNSSPDEDASFAEIAAARSTGDAYGVEISLRRSLSKSIGGFFSYTISRSTRTLDGEDFVNPFDRTHVAQAALSFKLGRGWTFGQRAVLYSGVPLSLEFDPSHFGRPSNGKPPQTVDEIMEEYLRDARELAELKKQARDEDLPDRMPPFFRVDLRLEKRWVFAPYYLSFVAEVQNLMGARDTLTYECAVGHGCAPDHFGPIVIPSIGIEGGL